VDKHKFRFVRASNVACKNILKVKTGGLHGSEKLDLKSDWRRRDRVKPYITLKEHKQDIVAMAMAGGNPTDLYPIRAYCLPGEYWKIINWIESFNAAWYSISSKLTNIELLNDDIPECVESQWLSGYVHCNEAFKVMNEARVLPNANEVVLWEQYLIKYGAD